MVKQTRRIAIRTDGDPSQRQWSHVGGQLRELRLAAGLTQQELASRAHSTQPALAEIEAGRRTPTLPTLEKLARALGQDLVVVVPCSELHEATS